VWHNPPNTSYSIFDPCGGPKELLNKFGPTPCVYIALLLQSGSLLVASLLGYLALRYAIGVGLVPNGLKSSAERIARIDLSNPLTALIATALSWSGLTIWTLSWFVFMPVLGFLFGKSTKQPAHSI
jgi:hypothetical protein